MAELNLDRHLDKWTKQLDAIRFLVMFLPHDATPHWAWRAGAHHFRRHISWTSCDLCRCHEPRTKPQAVERGLFSIKYQHPCNETVGWNDSYLLLCWKYFQSTTNIGELRYYTTIQSKVSYVIIIGWMFSNQMPLDTQFKAMTCPIVIVSCLWINPPKCHQEAWLISGVSPPTFYLLTRAKLQVLWHAWIPSHIQFS